MMILAPIAGWFGPLAEAPDPVFAGGMMGAGGLIDPVAGELRAPCDGVILNLPDSLHALTLGAGNGAEVLIHVGIETVGLKGKGFTAHIAEGQNVAAGDLLLSFDLDILAERAVSLQTPIVIANEGYQLSDMADPGMVASGDPLFRLVPSGGKGTPVAAPEGTPDIHGEVTILLRNGLHARPAARLADLAKQFDAQGWVGLKGKRASVRSPVALMTLGVGHGDTVSVETTGKDAEPMLASLTRAIEAGLGEEIIPVEGVGATPDTFAQHAEPATVPLDGTARLSGVTAAPGRVVGAMKHINGETHDVAVEGRGAGVEQNALLEAIGQVRNELREKLKKAQGQEEEILSAHLLLLDDETLSGDAERLIAEGKSAAYAWRVATENQIRALKALDAPLMRERADDLADLEQQVIARLEGKADGGIRSCEGTIIVAEDLYPSQFLRLAEAGAAGICLTRGGATSHVAILAAEKGIPALVAVHEGALCVPEGTSVILDADAGTLHVAPVEKALAEAKDAITRRQQKQATALDDAAEPAITQDGKTVKVFANLGGNQKAEEAVKRGAEGCGLLRTEFLYMGRSSAPSEEEQAAAYQAIADGLDGRPLVIRTLDIGGDKPAPFVQFAQEDNPALGVRGVRLTLGRRDLMETQLRAILRVKTPSTLHVMVPMVTSLDEILAVREMLRSLEGELGCSAPLPLGIMVETPAAAILADTLAPHVDFFSIGTNDLSQYALAMDRGNPQLAAQVDGFHPAVLRLIAMTAEAGASHGKWVGVCGSMASHPLAVPVLAGLGVTELSATSTAIPVVKAILRNLDMDDCRALAREVLAMESAEAVRKHVLSIWPPLQDWI